MTNKKSQNLKLDSFESIEAKTTEITDSLTDELILSYIRESFKVFKELKEKYGEESVEYINAKKEYIDLLKEINENKTNAQINTQGALLRIYSEFSDVQKTANSDWVDKRINEGLDKLDENSNKTIEGRRKGKKFEISIANFENELGELSVNKINSVALASYIQYLVNDLKLTSTKISERLLNVLGKGDLKLGVKKLKDLQNIWGGKKYSTSENILRKAGLGDVVDGVIKTSFREILESNYSLSSTLIDNFANKESIDKFKSGLNNQNTREKYLEMAGKENIEEQETPSLELLSYGLGIEIKTKKEVILNNLSVKYKLSKEESQEIFTKLENTSSAIEMVKILKLKLKVGSIKELISLILGVKEKEVQREKIEVEIAKREAGKDEEELKKVEERKTKLEKLEFEIEKDKIIEKHLDEKTIETISKGKNEDEILKDLREKNKNLNDELTKLESELKKEKNPKENIETLKNGYEVIQNKSNGNVESLKYEINGNVVEISDLSSNEKKLIQNNKENGKNIVKFRQTIEELKLGNLWKYRESIFKGLRGKYTNFDENDANYLNGDEMKLFLIGILVSTKKGDEKTFKNMNLIEIENHIKNINYNNQGTYFINGSYIHGLFIIESDFYKNFIDSKGKFKELDFEKSLSTKNES